VYNEEAIPEISLLTLREKGYLLVLPVRLVQHILYLIAIPDFLSGSYAILLI
jgi:hypothetical protein